MLKVVPGLCYSSMLHEGAHPVTRAIEVRCHTQLAKLSFGQKSFLVSLTAQVFFSIFGQELKLNPIITGQSLLAGLNCTSAEPLLFRAWY